MQNLMCLTNYSYKIDKFSLQYIAAFIAYKDVGIDNNDRIVKGFSTNPWSCF